MDAYDVPAFLNIQRTRAHQLARVCGASSRSYVSVCFRIAEASEEQMHPLIRGNDHISNKQVSWLEQELIKSMSGGQLMH